MEALTNLDLQDTMDLEIQVANGHSQEGSTLKKYVVECKKVDVNIGKMEILKGIDASFSPGELTALMGPSGSGKTTLMNAMSGRGAGEIESGELLLNGKKLKKSFIRKVSCLVPQLDVLFSVLTAKETFTYTARLALPHYTKKERSDRVREVLQSLSMENVQDVIVGDEDVKGLSGGERKRVSIGMEMITNPSIMFLDEPTSGLDAKIAKDVVELLKQLSQERTVICTIHQPSFQVFNLFDKLLLLNKGEMVYEGNVSRVSEHFESIGYPVPTFLNPADHMLEVLSDNSEARQEEPFTALFQKSSAFKVHEQTMEEATAMANTYGQDVNSKTLTKKEQREETRKRHKAGCTAWFQQLWVLFIRSFHITLKDKAQFRQRLFQGIFVGLIVGALFFDLANTQTTRFDRQSVLFIICMFSTMAPLMGTVVVLPVEKRMIKREYSNGYFMLSSFYIARISVLLVFQTLFTFVLVGILHPMVNLSSGVENVFVLFAAVLLLGYISVVLGFLLGTILPSVTAATQTVPTITIPLVFFSGLFIAPENIPDYFIWLYYLGYLQYAYTIMVVNEFKDRHLLPCTGEQRVTPGQCPFGPCNDSPFNSSLPAESCSGELVVESIGYSVDDQLFNFGILSMFLALCLMAGALVLKRFLNKAS